MIMIFKFEPEGHVLKFKHIIRYHGKLMRLKKRNVGYIDILISLMFYLFISNNIVIISL
jgi:hypothetical protein